MKTEIKTRIEEINSGKVPSGYKKTKIGIFPVEWEIKNLSKVLQRQTIKNKNNLLHNVLTNSATQGIISQQDYFDKQIANNDNTDGYYIVKTGYFVYNPRISVSAPCGPFNKYYGENDGIMSPLYTVYKYVDDSAAYSDFLAYLFSSTIWHGYMHSIANYGARSDRMSVTNEDMDNMPLQYPPVDEQEKIADILKTQDRIIELKEKLLKEKQREKKYLMQQLLTGKIRLKGFTDEWEKHKIGDYLTLSEIIANPNINKRITVRLHLEGIYKREIKAIEKEEATVQYVRRVGQFIYGKQNFHNGAFGIVPQELDGFQSSSDLPSFNISDKLNSIWFYNYCAREDFYKKMEISSSGTGSKRTKEVVFLKTNLFVPSRQEQNAIAEIITTKDMEIALIKQQIENEKQKKKALMQLLLSGIVRVS